MPRYETAFELGACEIEVEIDYTFEDGEPMVMYERDGSGYPGSPDHIEVDKVVVTSISGQNYDLAREEIDADCLQVLDKIATDHVDKNLSYITEEILESYCDD